MQQHRARRAVRLLIALATLALTLVAVAPAARADVEVRRTGFLRRAAALRSAVEQALMGAVPGLRATIQLLPTDVEAHFDDPKDLL